MTAFLAALLGVPFQFVLAVALLMLVARGLSNAQRLGKALARAVRPAWLRLQVAALRASAGRDLVYLAADYRAPEPDAAPLRRHAEGGRRCGHCEGQLRAAVRLAPLSAGDAELDERMASLDDAILAAVRVQLAALEPPSGLRRNIIVPGSPEEWP